MAANPGTTGPIRFGVFEVDLRSGELRKQGVRIRLGEQPFSVLAVLLERPGQAVTRDELQKRLWPADTFVDFDHGLNKAINRLRDALGDSADSPRFIETLPRRGYRFIGAVATPVVSPTVQAIATPAIATPASPSMPSREAGSRRPALAWGVGALAAVLAGALWWAATPHPARGPSDPVVRSSILPPPGTSFVPYSIALSSDGTHLAFVAETTEGARSLFVRALSTTTAERLAGTDGASLPFWSPDQRSVGFFADRHLKVVDLAGGAVRVLADARRASGGTWNADGIIVFAPDVNGPLYRIAAAGGAPAAVTRLADAPDVQGHRWPVFLADGRHFLYLAVGSGAAVPEDDSEVRLGSLDDSASEALSPLRARSLAVALDRAFAVRDGVLQAYPLDVATGRAGTPVPVAGADVSAPPTFFPSAFAVAGNGVLVFQSAAERTSELTWLDPHGREQGPLGSVRYVGPTFSPDGTRLAGSCDGPRSGTLSICVYDLARGVGARITPGPADRYAVWSPDGREIAYASGRAIYRMAADGSTAPQLVSTRGIPTDWTRDGRVLSFGTHAGEVSLALSSIATHEVTELWPGAEGRLSPGGTWLAYIAPEGLTARPYPAFAPRVAIAGPGMAQPRWSHDGRRLFFIAPDRKLMAVDFDPKTGAAGSPRIVAQTRIVGTGLTMFQYDIAADGRVLVNATPREPAPLTVMTGWAGRLR
jgi:DNA-binding winged helix-turn-helix (wHTH) protein